MGCTGASFTGGAAPSRATRWDASELGKWRVEKDQLCIEFDKDPPAKCYEVWMSGKTVELRREGLMPLQGVIEQPSGRK